MPACEICGVETGEGRPCARCGHPLVSAEASRLMAEAADLSSVGQPELALRKIQQAAKLDGNSWVPRLKLAMIYESRASSGEPALQTLAERELSEAMRLGPMEREVHAARIERAARRGGLQLLRGEYTEKLDTLPVAGECLRMIEAMEQAAKAAGEGEKLPPPAQNYRAKMFLVSGLMSAICTFGMVLKVVVKYQNYNDYVFVGGGDFWATLLWLTATMVLGLEYLRASGKLKKK